jgi:molybdopterin synthase sulfur carrier subunit
LSITVSIPVALQQFTGIDSKVDVDASTVEETLTKLDEHFPGLRAFLLDESNHLRRYVNIFVNMDNIRSGDGLGTRLKDGDQIRIIPAVAGG